LFKIEPGEEGDIQIATLLNVGIETIQSSFTQLWADQRRLQELIRGLNNLKDNLTAIKVLFSALSNALGGVISDTQSLLSTWTDVQTRLATVETVDRKVTDIEMNYIVRDWTKAQEDAQTYVNAVTGSATLRVLSGYELLEAAKAPQKTQVSDDTCVDTMSVYHSPLTNTIAVHLPRNRQSRTTRKSVPPTEIGF
jgi:hypothetical protein